MTAKELGNAQVARAEALEPGGTRGDAGNWGQFVLNEALVADTLAIGRLGLSRLLLMNDATYPWLILVPERPNVRELFELGARDRSILMEEIAAVSRAADEIFEPDKLNVAAIGNVVPQLHVHIVARFRSDPVWPAPVWGRTPPCGYAPAAAEAIRAQLRQRLGPALAEIF